MFFLNDVALKNLPPPYFHIVRKDFIKNFEPTLDSKRSAAYEQVRATHLSSTPYHPQTNGKVERYNSTMDVKIAALSNLHKTDWDDQLPFANIFINSKNSLYVKHYGLIDYLWNSLTNYHLAEHYPGM